MRSTEQSGTLSLLLGRVTGVAGALAAGQILTGLAYVVAARALAPYELGTVATVAAVAMIAATVFDAGLDDLLVREIASGALELRTARGALRTKRRLLPLLLAPVLAVGLFLVETDVVTAVLLAFLGPAVWEAQVANAMLRAEERFAAAASGQVIGRGAGLVVVLVGVVGGHALLALPAGLLASFATEALLDRIRLGPAGSRALPAREVLPLCRRGISYGLTSLAASAQQLDTPLVAAGGGVGGAGLYAAAGRLLGPLGFLPTALSLVGAPWLARVRHNGSRLRHEERRFLAFAGALCVAPVLAAVVGPFLVPLILGEQYRVSGAVFAVLAIGSVMSTLNQPLAVIVQNRGRQNTVGLVVAIGLALGLLVTFALATIGPVWAALGFTVSQVFITFCMSLTLRLTRVAETGAPT